MPFPASLFWRLRFARWSGAADVTEDGYTVLLPVPGDLPVFTDLALAVCRAQTHAHRVRTLVIPDHRSASVQAAVEREAPTWPGGDLHVVDLPLVDQLVLPRLGDPGRNHGAQLVAGVRKASSRRVVLHDADLFMLDPHLHDRLYEKGEANDLDVIGISPAWDSWYADRGRELVATWEQSTRTAWLRSFAPHRHLGHEADADGEQHVFDTTFWAQWRSDPASIAVDAREAADVVHFNYVISTYRRFQRQPEVFHDNNFRLLLIRLMVDLFAHGDAPDQLPTLEELARGLGGGEHPVVYREEDGTVYRDFRARIGRVLEAPWVDPARVTEARALLAPFDDQYTEGAARTDSR